MRRPLLRLAPLLLVVGPGVLAGLSDDDPPGVTTYSILGTDYGYTLLWVLAASTVALVVFHELGARMGIVTGQGAIGLVRQRFGVRVAAVALAALLVANVGTLCGQFAGIAAAGSLVDLPRWVVVPAAAALVSWLVLRSRFARVEHVLLIMGSTFVAYAIAGVMADPDWGAVAKGFVPGMPDQAGAPLAAAATVGTTLAPWGLAFIQSYVADKRLDVRDLRLERVDVIIGAILTGVLGGFVVIACAATLHPAGVHIDEATDAAAALAPLAGSGAAVLFGIGLIGSGLLAVSVLPLSTAYSVTDAAGAEAALNDRPRDAPLFYWSFGVVMVIAAVVVCLPGVPLVPILYLTQALNALLLIPLIVLMWRLGRDRHLMGNHRLGAAGSAAALLTIVFVTLTVAAMIATPLIR